MTGVGCPYEWEQTKETVIIRVQLGPHSKAERDIFVASAFVKVNAKPYIFLADLYDHVSLKYTVTEEARVDATGGCELRITLTKRAPVQWPGLKSPLVGLPLLERRRASIADVQRALQTHDSDRKTVKEAADKANVETHWAREAATRAAIEARIKAEYAAVDADLQAWMGTTGAAADGAATTVTPSDVLGDDVVGSDAAALDVPPPRSGTLIVRARHNKVVAQHVPLRTISEADAYANRRYKPKDAQDTPWWHKDQGDALLRRGDAAGAAAAYTAALLRDPMSIGALQNRAVAALRLHRYADAVEDCTAALALVGSTAASDISLERYRELSCRIHARRAAALLYLALERADARSEPWVDDVAPTSRTAANFSAEALAAAVAAAGAGGNESSSDDGSDVDPLRSSVEDLQLALAYRVPGTADVAVDLHRALSYLGARTSWLRARRAANPHSGALTRRRMDARFARAVDAARRRGDALVHTDAAGAVAEYDRALRAVGDAMDVEALAGGGEAEAHVGLVTGPDSDDEGEGSPVAPPAAAPKGQRDADGVDLVAAARASSAYLRRTRAARRTAARALDVRMGLRRDAALWKLMGNRTVALLACGRFEDALAATVEVEELISRCHAAVAQEDGAADGDGARSVLVMPYVKALLRRAGALCGLQRYDAAMEAVGMATTLLPYDDDIRADAEKVAEAARLAMLTKSAVVKD